MEKYSYSRLSCFRQCRLKYRFQYIDKIKTEIEQTIEAFMGSRVHDALEKLYKDLKYEKLNTVEELIRFYDSEWEKHWSDNIVIVKKDLTRENYQMMGEKYIREFYTTYQPFDQGKTIGLETQKFVALDEQYQMHVRIDRLALSDDVYEIHDYKTSNSLPTQEEIEKDTQLLLYAYGVRKMYPDARKIKLIWHYLAFDKELSRMADGLEELRLNILENIKEVEASRDFEPEKSPLCDWCQYIRICPLFRHKFMTEEMGNEYMDETGVKLVNRYVELKEQETHAKAELEKVKDALYNYVKKEGVTSVYGTSKVASVKAYPRLNFPKKNDPNRKEFEDMIKKSPLWEELSQVDVYDLAKRINKNEVDPELAEKIKRFASESEAIYVFLRNK